MLRQSGIVFPGSIYYPQNILMSDDGKDNEASEKKRLSISALLKSGSFRILLADDDADDRDFFVEAVAEIAGQVRVEYAQNGSELLALLQDEDRLLPHLVFLDLNMPNKTGGECLEAIRQDPRLKNLPVVIYSTSSSPKDIDDTFKKGANLYVRKPTSFNELVIIAQKVLMLDWDKYKPHASRSNYVFSSKTN